MAETMERGDVVVSIAAEMKGTVGAETKTTYATATAPPEGEARNVAALPQPDLPLAIQRTLRMKMWTILNVANCLSIGIGYYLRYTPSLYAMVGGIEAGFLVFILLILSGGLMQKSQTRPALAPAATLLFVVVSGVFLAVCSPLFKSHVSVASSVFAALRVGVAVATAVAVAVAGMSPPRAFLLPRPRQIFRSPSRCRPRCF